MDQKIWQVTFKYNVSPEELMDAFAPLADPISQVPGLLWKTWIVDNEESVAGGIYLFSDQDAVDAYVDSEIVAGILSHPALSDFNVKTFDILEGYSLKTRAPIGEAATA
jgi:hypothetical protein